MKPSSATTGRGVRWPVKRCVWRKGCRVYLQLVVGPFVGRVGVYRFDTEREAEAFEEIVCRKDSDGLPVVVPERYRLCREERKG